MVRGGRSCPSETKLGAGAEMPGKKASVTPSRTGTVGGLLTSGAAEQQSEHRLHFSEVPEVDPWSSCTDWAWAAWSAWS